MKKRNYTIIRCQTTDKYKVMDLLCDAEEYKLVNDHVDIVYYNGDSSSEVVETRNIIKQNVSILVANGIQADSKPEYVDEWLFIPVP